MRGGTERYPPPAQYNNPQETYNYYYLPFCKPAGAGKAAHKWGGLGEVLEGNQLIDSQLEVKYRCESPIRRDMQSLSSTRAPRWVVHIAHDRVVQPRRLVSRRVLLGLYEPAYQSIAV